MISTKVRPKRIEHLQGKGNIIISSEATFSTYIRCIIGWAIFKIRRSWGQFPAVPTSPPTSGDKNAEAIVVGTAIQAKNKLGKDTIHVEKQKFA